MANVTVFKDNEIFLQTGILKPNDLYTKVSIDSLITKYGLIIPLECNWPVIYDYFDGTIDEIRQAEVANVCNILTPSGKLYEFRVPNKSEEHKTYMLRRRVHYGQGVTYVRGAASKLEEQMTMAVHITKSLDEAGQLLRKCSLGGLPPYEIWKVEDILALLHAKGFTEDHNLKPPIRKITTEERRERMTDRLQSEVDESMGYAEPMNQATDNG